MVVHRQHRIGLILQTAAAVTLLLLPGGLYAQTYLPNTYQLSESRIEQPARLYEQSFFDAAYRTLANEVQDVRTDPTADSPYSLVAQTSLQPGQPVPQPPVGRPSTMSPVQAAPTSPQAGLSLRPADAPNATGRGLNSSQNQASGNPNRPSPRSRSQLSRRPVRLARAPNMFGDFWNTPPTLFFETPLINASDQLVERYIPGEAQSPLMFGGRRLKVTENGNVLPSHRIYFNYNHFADASRSSFDEPGESSYDVDESGVDIWTLGLERPFGREQNWSFEFRLPIYQSVNSGHSFEDPIVGDIVSFGAGDGGVGNLSFILKRVLYESQYTAVGAGLGLSLPTAEDVDISVRRVTMTFENSTVDMTPWIGLSRTTPDGWFFQGVMQLNVPLGGNKVSYNSGIDPLYVADSFPEAEWVGTYNLQSLFSVDLAIGKWLFRRPGRRGLTGLAAIAELHATTTLQDSDVLKEDAGALASVADSETAFVLKQPTSQQQIVNMTFGIHTTFSNNLSIRFAQVVPLNSGAFSTESQVQVGITF